MPRTREQLVHAFASLLDEAIEIGRQGMLDELLAQVDKATSGGGARAKAAVSHRQTVSPQKRGAQDRAAHGAIKGAVRDSIYAHPEGISRPDIVRYAQERLNVTIKEGSLKNAIRILKDEKEITNRERKWFPTRISESGKPGGGTPGRQLDLS
jgi:hypothetical protein